MKILFFTLIISLTSSFTFAEPMAEHFVKELPGHYIGTDQLDRPCLISVSLNKENGTFFFNAASASEGKLILLEGIPSKKLQQKIIDDTAWREKNDRDFNSMMVTVNYYLHDNQLGGAQQEVAVEWLLPSFIPASISLVEEQSNGFYISNRKRIDCFGIKKK